VRVVTASMGRAAAPAGLALDRDVARLAVEGKPAIAGTVRSVSGDRTSSVYAFNLAGAALGVRDVVVDSFAGSSGSGESHGEGVGGDLVAGVYVVRVSVVLRRRGCRRSDTVDAAADGGEGAVESVRRGDVCAHRLCLRPSGQQHRLGAWLTSVRSGGASEF
jgi:hypothetical protein